MAAGTKDFQRMVLEEAQSLKQTAKMVHITRLAQKDRAFSPVATNTLRN